MKILITENQLRKVQFKYLDYLFEGMYEVEMEKYPNHRFWVKNNEKILVLYDFVIGVPRTIWQDISNMLSLNNEETKILLKNYLQQRLGIKRLLPAIGRGGNFDDF